MHNNRFCPPLKKFQKESQISVCEMKVFSSDALLMVHSFEWLKNSQAIRIKNTELRILTFLALIIKSADLKESLNGNILDKLLYFFVGAFQSHCLREHTFTSLQYCDVCRKLMFGLVRQGYLCRGKVNAIVTSWRFSNLSFCPVISVILSQSNK